MYLSRNQNNYNSHTQLHAHTHQTQAHILLKLSGQSVQSLSTYTKAATSPLELYFHAFPTLLDNG